jgi:glucose-1-phosphate thymidylyltransferase
MKLEYAVQPRPNGRAQAFICSGEFLAGAANALVLGNKIFYRHHLQPRTMRVDAPATGATLFADHAQDPGRYVVVAFGADGKASGIEEKPHAAKSNHAATSLYFYDGQVVEIAKSIEPIARGEFEITAVDQVYLASRQINVKIKRRGSAWFDTQAHDSLLGTGQLIATMELRQGLKIARLQEIACSSLLNDRGQP